ncbi:hypothetical protein D3C71_966410 [compost metagenome]
MPALWSLSTNTLPDSDRLTTSSGTATVSLPGFSSTCSVLIAAWLLEVPRGAVLPAGSCGHSAGTRMRTWPGLPLA